MSVMLRCWVFGYSLFVKLSAHEQQFPPCSACCFLPASKNFAGLTGAVAVVIATIVAIVPKLMQGLVSGLKARIDHEV